MAQFRIKLCRLLLTKEAKEISLYEGLMMARAAWATNVTPETIKNCWSKSGLRKDVMVDDYVEMLNSIDNLEVVADLENTEKLLKIANWPLMISLMNSPIR